MKSNFLLSILMLISSQISLAQGINGKVIDSKSKESIFGASVEIKEMGLHTKTNEEGEFAFNKVSGEITLVIHAPGYDSFNKLIYGESNHLEIELIPVDQIVDEIVVSIPGGTLQKSVPVHVEVMDMDELRSIPASSIGDLIKNIPGVENAASGPGVSKPVIRGLSGNRVVSVLNGMRLENQQWGGDHGLGVTELGIDKVEVIKGPASLLYGSDALGGVIFFRDDYIKTNNSFDVTASTQFESASTGLTTNLWVQHRKEKFHVNLGFRSNDQWDYQVPNQKYSLNTRFNERVGKMVIGFGGDNWTSMVNYNYFNSKVGIAGPHNHEGEEDEGDEEHDEVLISEQERYFESPLQFYENHYLSSETKFYTEKGKMTMLIGQTVADLKEFEESFVIPSMNSRLSNSILNLTWEGKFSGELKYVLGYQGMLQLNRNDKDAEETLLDDANQLDNGIYALLNWHRGNWNWQGGSRLDTRLLEAYPESGSVKLNYNAINFALGGARAKGKGVTRINASSGVRMPHMSELFAEGEHHGTNRYEIGNIQLKSERGVQFDLSHEQSGEHIGVIVNPFISAFQNYIYLMNLDSLINDLPAYKYEQMQNMFMMGGEAGVHYHPHFLHMIHWESTISFVIAEGTSGPLNFIPQGRIANTVKLKIPISNSINLSDFVVQHYYYLPQDRVGEFETSSVDYHVLNIGASFELIKDFGLKIGLGVKNVLNETYINHLSRLKGFGVPNVGRSFYFDFRINI